MSDYELYGDYNEVDEPPKKSGVGFIIKIVAIALCFAVVAFIGFRLFTFNYYPSSVTRLYFNDTLTQYYNDNDGNIDVRTQKLTSYNDPKEGDFFAGYWLIIREAGQLQVTIRYNTALADKLGVDFENDDIRFTVRRSGGDENAKGAAAGVDTDATLSVCEWDEFMMYRYSKLVFDGVDFDESVDWLRLDIRIDGVEREEPFMLTLYDASVELSEYKLSTEDRP